MTPNVRLFSFHLSFVLLLTLGVYVVRDVAPLFVRNWFPADSAEGVLLWVKLFVLFEVAVAVPLVTPRVYEPYDPAVSTDNNYIRLWA